MEPLDIAALQRACVAGRTFRFRFFWQVGPRAADRDLDDTCLSQWWPSPFEAAGERYASAEQYMMASKARLFGDGEVLASITAASDAKTVKALGRQVRGFDVERWEREREGIVTAGSVAKFRPPPLRAYLLATGDDVLVEASPTDRVWGIGLPAEDPGAREPAQWPGLNLLGFALMRARSILGRAPG